MADDASRAKSWSGTGRLRGGRRGLLFFITALRVLGLRLTYALAVPPAIYFSFFSPDVPATMDYHRRVLGSVPWRKRRWLVFRHFFSFGRTLIDRTAILAGGSRHFSFTFDGEQHLREAVACGKVVLLLTAHFGNWDAAGQLLTRLNVPVSVTGFDREAPEVRALLNQSTRANFRLIPLTGSPTDAIPLVAALRRGEIVAMLGDRTYGSPSARVPFLGGLVSLPIGAYVLAAIADSPLVQVFSLREAGGHYRFIGFPPIPPYHPPHHERAAHLRNCAAQFAANLESMVRRDPLQWYNFFPFWERNAESDQESATPSAHPADETVSASLTSKSESAARAH